jgi:hypothetical protein
MRKTTFIAFVILLASCSPTEKTYQRSVVTEPSLKKVPVNVDALYEILKEHELITASLSRVKISVISDHIMDVSAPDAPKYVAALVETRGVRSTIIAVFDPVKGMDLVGYTKQTFPDVISYYDDLGNERTSGQGPDLIAHPIRLSDSGDVIAVTVKSEKQYVQGSEDDEDVWLFALWKNEVVMLMGYSKNFTHLLSDDKGYARTRTLDTEFIVSNKKTRGLHDVILKSIAGDGDNQKETTEIEHIFNGVEYIQK